MEKVYEDRVKEAELETLRAQRDKLELESREIRERLDETKKTVNWSVRLNSKLGILLLGVFLSGIIVPAFQYNQRAWEWKRENQYQAFQEQEQRKYILLKHVIASMVYVTRSSDVVMNLIKDNDTSAEAVKHALEVIAEAQSNRFEVNTSISYEKELIDDKELSISVGQFFSAYNELIVGQRDMVIALYDDPKARNSTRFGKSVAELVKHADGLNQNYTTLIASIKQSIQRTKDENKTLNFF
ncbi:hypothetical protein [Dasania marina]|uniref:hypothetical protein n=1 Tax=Dasania marina TaxID=471499 RepID=UPI0003774DE0|nr:hypothetical protein [Dasania marina]